MGLVNPQDIVASAMGLFSDRGYIFDPYKYESIEIGDVKLPLQPLVSYRQRKNMIITPIYGSSQDPDLSGATVKENVGMGEAYITIDGYFYSSDPTMVQNMSKIISNTNYSEKGIGLDWVEHILELWILFNQEGALPIKDKSERFLSLGIEKVVLRSLRINDGQGTDKRAYRLELLQDRPLEISKLLPTEEG